jgi:mannose-1-phosphate guanylyltransferase / phosphomannomutase
MDPSKITRSEKEFQHSLDQLSSIVTTLKADIGFLIDNGAEKIFIVDENGRTLSNAQALAAGAFLAGKCYDSGSIAVPLNQSGIFERILSRSKLKVTRTPTLARHIISSAKNEGMRMVGDGIGGFIFPEFQKAFDAMYAITKILEMLAQQKTRIGKVMKEIAFRQEVHHKKLPCPWDKKGQVMRLAFEHAKNRKPDLIEGVKIFFKDSWVLLSPDPDEAYFHLYVEAETTSRAKELLREYSEKITHWTL